MKKINLNKSFPYILIVCGIVGLVASLILSHDTLAVIKNPNFKPFCNLNPVLSCGTVISTKGDTILGLPYPFYGIGVFAILIAVGAGMVAGAKFKRWYWLAFQGGVTLGTVGAYYLLGKSIYSIHALCPFCLTVDIATTALFWYVTLYNIDNKNINIKGAKFKKAYGWVRRHHLDLLVLWYLIAIAFILHHFWYYYGKHIHI